MADKSKVLYVLHNHPASHPGGAEAYALELYEAMRNSDDYEPLLVARTGPTPTVDRQSHPGAPFSVAGDDPGQYLVFTDAGKFDFFLMTSSDKSLYYTHFTDFLRAHRPDIVHFQHTLFIGYDLISQTRRVLPSAPILYTLHEYLGICNRQGQMLRVDGQPCTHASPQRCNECFPLISPQHFFLRERFIKSHFRHVDMFLAPSRFLLERYVDWGIPRERIRAEDYGRLRETPFEEQADEDRPRNRFGFFGQVNYFKGVNLLLEAMQILGEDAVEAQLRLHGANLEFQKDDFKQEFAERLEAANEKSASAVMQGGYSRRDLAGLMADVDWVVVPSLWWENSPLVIQEAFLHGRPVICSGIGGMAEKVADGVNGLHFRAGDPVSLARTLRRAATEPGLWESLRRHVPDVYPMEDHLTSLNEIYGRLLDSRRQRREPAPAA